jgi:hypothetical protein
MKALKFGIPEPDVHDRSARTKAQLVTAIAGRWG